LAQDKDKWWGLVNLQVPKNLGNFLTSWGSNSSSGRTLLHATLISLHTYTAVHNTPGLLATGNTASQLQSKFTFEPLVNKLFNHPSSWLTY
jgi:hypothetical protein